MSLVIESVIQPIIAFVFSLLSALFPAETGAVLVPEPGPAREIVATNDNRRPAGLLADGVLRLSLRAGGGAWRPEGPNGPAVEIEAFGEVDGELSAPAPLIRVPEGTEIAASVRNDLASPLRVHGLCTRDGTPCAPVAVAPGATSEVRFVASRAGTYHYWATSTGMPLAFRGSVDTQLSGALIVDPKDVSAEPDRVLVITEWTSLTPAQIAELTRAEDIGEAFVKLDPRGTFLVNGLSWPATERLTYRVGERVRWRILNLSTQPHPMHLHGFYFDVNSLGDGLEDARRDADHPRRVVTELLAPGATMGMAWTPERTGNWLFHCHVMIHSSPALGVGHAHGSGHQHKAGHDASAGMAGLVLGVEVLGGGSPADAASEDAYRSARKLTLVVDQDYSAGSEKPALGFALGESEMPRAGSMSAPGPTLVLERGQPVEIAVVNKLAEMTSIHWHGIELDSYYDGVHGWSGSGRRLTPAIEPGETFTVRFTPPRTGTFIYHSHLHDHRQLPSGLYGALVVVEPGERFDEATDHVVVVGRSGAIAPGGNPLTLKADVVINGARAPRFVWKAGLRHRVRLINITPDDVVAASLEGAAGPVQWTPLTKDGAPLPAVERIAKPAVVRFGVGETYDFEFQAPASRQNVWLNVRLPGGKWLAQAQVVVK